MDVERGAAFGNKLEMPRVIQLLCRFCHCVRSAYTEKTLHNFSIPKNLTISWVGTEGQEPDKPCLNLSLEAASLPGPTNTGSNLSSPAPPCGKGPVGERLGKGLSDLESQPLRFALIGSGRGPCRQAKVLPLPSLSMQEHFPGNARGGTGDFPLLHPSLVLHHAMGSDWKVKTRSPSLGFTT